MQVHKPLFALKFVGFFTTFLRFKRRRRLLNVLLPVASMSTLKSPIKNSFYSVSSAWSILSLNISQ